MAVLEHIHPDSEFVFSERVRIAKNFLITIEDERGLSWKHSPRNYRRVFESRGAVQVWGFACGEVKGLSPTYVARIFRKA